ncbi:MULTISPECIES: alpha/beta hydrolase fold domain-containing protein [unclassified Streptomyces]|uniref:alpha/beta hydrolase fold domain-containing protein n=1 Tax=unclassified Streptomyces TaxID=2593676 RepID=UPI0022583220|nr:MULTISPECIES: alpha/beta hydrolase fold domain-containing protein [unclassified Streptomyces]MCX4993035.1 alpha/beta hydrolase [Streptomyces sp. NBC_00568]MCX5001729.1 alpha/beta hydrolase [Streptomyces sp. NBC_00638]
MSLLARPAVAALAARSLQRLALFADRRPAGRGSAAAAHARLPEFPRRTRELTIPTTVAPARATVYLPESVGPPPVHVNFHGGGYVMPLTELDDPLCRCLAASAGVVVVNVDYVVAPQHPFPAPTRQAFEVVRWIAEHGAEQGWDGSRLTIGGQSAGGGLAAAVARQALAEGGPAVALQVLHYPPLDLVTGVKDKPAPIPRPVLRPWMGEIFDSSYVPNPRERSDPLVSPAHPSDTGDLNGIAPALLVTAEFDLLKPEGERYAGRLRKAGALVDHVDVPKADHGYDGTDDGRAREIYALIARHVRQAVGTVASAAD